MIPILNAHDWCERVMTLPRPGSEKILAFYEHRVGAICHDVRCMLVPMDDHLVHRGDAVFETLLVTERKVINLADHLKRLKYSADGLKLALPCSLADIEKIILEIARISDVAEANIRVLVGRGMGGFGISPDECETPSLYVVEYVCTPRSELWYAKGLTACRSAIPLKAPVLARLKTTNYATSVMMSQEASEKGVDIALAFDSNNCLAEGAIASIAIVDKDGVFVMPVLDNILAGTTALKAFALLGETMPVAMREIPEAELDSVQELMILGTSHECVGVTQYEDLVIADGKPGLVAQRARHLLHEALLSEGTAF